jgi:hypothetical protein
LLLTSVAQLVLNGALIGLSRMNDLGVVLTSNKGFGIWIGALASPVRGTIAG